MRIDLHSRFQKRIEKLSEAERQEISACLTALAEGFGKPHIHSGIAIRRLKRDLFECRAGLHWRIIFFAEKGLLTIYDVMTHGEVQAWLRSC